MTKRAAVLVALAACGCAGGHRGPEAERARALPEASGALVLTDVDFPESGRVFGGHFSGATFDVRQSSYQMTEAVRTRWGRDAQRRGEALMRGAGLRVHALGPSTSDATQIRGIQYGLSGRVADLAVRSSGAAEPFRIEVQAEVVWELLDLGSGEAVFGRSVRGTARETGGLDGAVARAVDQSLERLLADSSFRYTLAELRPDPDAGTRIAFGRPPVAEGEVITLAPHDLNPSGDSTITGRVAAGLALLRNPDASLGTAFFITRDGLALTSGRAVRNLRRIRARLPNGVERPLRVVRVHRGLDVALIQVACGECVTVDWEALPSIDVYTNIFTVAAPLRDLDGPTIGFGRVGGRWFLANGVTLVDLPDSVVSGGEPVARTASGKVFAQVSTRAGRRSALMLGEVLAALKVRAPGQ